jgi:hypothetical protein
VTHRPRPRSRDSPDSHRARARGSRGPAPLSYPGTLPTAPFLPPRTHSPRVPPGLPASLSHCPPLAVQRPQHSDRAPCNQRTRTPPALRSRDQISAAHTPPTQNPIVDVPGLHQAAMQPRGTPLAPQPDATRGSGADRNPEIVSARRAPAPRDVASTSGSSPAQAPRARAPNATSQHRWGGVYPKPTLLLSVRGCEWGSKPLSSDTYSTSRHGRMRMQVRLAAPGEHRGGFGTCGRKSTELTTTT